MPHGNTEHSESTETPSPLSVKAMEWQRRGNRATSRIISFNDMKTQSDTTLNTATSRFICKLQLKYCFYFVWNCHCRHRHAAAILNLYGVAGALGSLLAALLNVFTIHAAALAGSTSPPQAVGLQSTPEQNPKINEINENQCVTFRHCSFLDIFCMINFALAPLKTSKFKSATPDIDTLHTATQKTCLRFYSTAATSIERFISKARAGVHVGSVAPRLSPLFKESSWRQR